MKHELFAHRGRFRLSRDLLDTNPARAMAILSCQLVIYRAEMRYEQDAVYYWAFSPHFDPIADGTYPPDYDVMLSDQEGVTFQRRVP